MLSTSVGIISPSSIGGGQYTVSLFFSVTDQARYVRVGDTLQDSSGNQYQVSSWTAQPSDFASGGTMTISFITVDTLPQVDSGFDSLIFTPGQVDVRPPVRTSGTLFNISFISGQNLEYEARASWLQNDQALLATTGDSIVDASGKEYYIASFTGTQFDDPIRIREIVAEGVAPSAGSATLYRSTVNFDFFQGTELTDPARTVTRNRDDFNIDAALKSLQDQIGGSNAGISSTMENNTGATIVKSTPVRINSFGDAATINPSTEDEALAVVGIASDTISDGASGTIVTAGKVTDITTTATFDDTMYVSKAGLLTNVKPDIGVSGFVAGDFVVSVGVISKNESNPALKDLIVNIQIVGQL